MSVHIATATEIQHGFWSGEQMKCISSLHWSLFTTPTWLFWLLIAKLKLMQIQLPPYKWHQGLSSKKCTLHKCSAQVMVSFFAGISENKNKPKRRKEIIWIPNGINSNWHSILMFRYILSYENFMSFIFCQTWNYHREVLAPMFIMLASQASGYSRSTHWALVLLILDTEWFVISVFIGNRSEMSMIHSVLAVTSLYFQGSGPRYFSSIWERFLRPSDHAVRRLYGWFLF